MEFCYQRKNLTVDLFGRWCVIYLQHKCEVWLKNNMRGVKRNMKIDANGTEITVMGDVVNEDAYISLTDIAKYKNPDNAFIYLMAHKERQKDANIC